MLSGKILISFDVKWPNFNGFNLLLIFVGESESDLDDEFPFLILLLNEEDVIDDDGNVGVKNVEPYKKWIKFKYFLPSFFSFNATMSMRESTSKNILLV